MANTTDIQHTCGECTFYNHGYCVKTRMNGTPRFQYACAKFMTDEEYIAERERAKNERMERNEVRFNFLLTAMEVSATATQMLMEYFDSLFADHMVERNWRQERKKAAKDIRQCAERMRSIFQHTFMVDQMNVMTKHGKQDFDADQYDRHEGDARMHVLKLLYDLDRCWLLPEKDQQVLELYQSMPDNGSFDKQDYNHFNR